MPILKNSTILSDISIFFKKNDSNNALLTIMEMLNGINMSEKTLPPALSRKGMKNLL
jgi:hypothetical protein